MQFFLIIGKVYSCVKKVIFFLQLKLKYQ